jgi:hypothetical protein
LSEGWKNRLYYGDNLVVLRESIAEESIDLAADRPGLGRPPEGVAGINSARERLIYGRVSASRRYNRG